jgi:citrate lyase alpha subunit
MNNDQFWKDKLTSKTKETRPTVIFMNDYEQKHYANDIYEENEGWNDMPFGLKTLITLTLTFAFVVGIFICPVLKPDTPVIISEKTTTVVDSVSAFDINDNPDILEQQMNKKKQEIANANEAIKEFNEKKQKAEILKENGREILVVSALVEDGEISREIKAEAEVDSVTDEAIDMLSKSLQTTLDSIALETKVKNFIEIQSLYGNSNHAEILSAWQNSRRLNRMTGILGL